MKKLLAILSTVAQINLALMVVAAVNGIAFSVYYYVENDSIGLFVAERYMYAVASLLVLWGSVAYLLRRYVIESIIDAMAVTAITWLVVPLSSSVIYMFSLGKDFVDAFFESLSGFSGTGLTVFTNLDNTPYVVLVWRAMTQWLGELGVVVVAGVILPSLHASLRRVYYVERGPRLVATIRGSIINLFVMYSAYTLLGIVLLLFSGMGVLDAFAHSMTAIATGGMSTKDQSIGYWYYQGYKIVLVTSSIIMVIGALNFRDLYNLSRGRLREFVKSPEVLGFFGILAVLASIVTAIAYALNMQSMETVYLYHLLSAYTTTGFQIGDLRGYPTAIKILLIVAMAIGGATFSTAGGIKTRRVVIALKEILWDIRKTALPPQYIAIRRLGDEDLTDEAVLSAITYIILYILSQFILSSLFYISLIINGVTQYDYVDALFETTSALSCVGLSVGITAPTLPLASKAILMLAMYLGRLEFLPIYLAIGVYYRKKMFLG